MDTNSGFYADGYPYNFKLYKGKDEGQKDHLGTSVVKRMSVLLKIRNVKTYPSLWYFFHQLLFNSKPCS